MIGAFLFFGYLLLGAWIALRYDAHEMKQPVPYGDWPSVAPLRTIRIAAACVFIFLGPYSFTREAILILAREITRPLRVRLRARRRFR